jgi:CubicO group peptidase (beta-lactamase class C family)
MQHARAVIAVGVVTAGLALGSVGPAPAAVAGARTASPAASPRVAAAPHPVSAATCSAGVQGKAGKTVRRVVKKYRAEGDMKAAIVRVTKGGKNVATIARGKSMTGVRATIDMRFRSGAVAIAHLATALLLLVEDGKAKLDDPVRKWVRDKRIDKRITLRMLANSTSGIPDYVPMEDFDAEQTSHPFRHFSEQQLLAYAFSHPNWYAPGKNWSYSHANFVLLGQALSAISGMPLKKLLRQRVFKPAGLTATTSHNTATIPGDALHAYSTDRGVYEDTTYWNPSWTLAHGAIETTDICDMATSARVIGEGDLLTKKSYRAMIAPKLVGLGGPTATCPVGICRKQVATGYYGLGVVVLGGWILQNPSLGGYGAVHAYLPAKDLSIAIIATKTTKADVDAQVGFELFQRIAHALAPGSPPRA